MNPLPFIGPAYQSRSANFSSQRCVNLYLEPGKGKAPALLLGTPGLTSPWLTLAGSSGIRGMHLVSASVAIIVCGGSVYKVTSAAVATSIGSVPDDGASVQITGNGSDVIVVSAGDMWSFTLSGTSGTFIRSGIASVDFLDDHFVAVENNSGFFIWSDVGTTTFDPLNIQATNGAPDVMVGIRVARRTMYLFGDQSLEQWYSSGGVDAPFSRIDGAFFEVGCVAKNSIAELDQVFWLGGDANGAGAVWTVTGGAPQRISTPAIEYAIGQWADMSTAEAFTYSQEGHSFYILSSTSANETWAYDISTGEWHQRAYLHASGELRRVRPRCHLYFAGLNLVGDYENGNIYAYDLDTYSDNGNPLPAIRACSTLQNGLEVMKTVSFQLDMDTGVGLTTGQGSDPQAMLRWSQDGGKTWSNSLWRSFGAIGAYSKRAIWRRVGGGRRSVFEITITDPVKRAITGAFVM
jgi:hypothetical protein